ncbi:MAG TPA: sugar phosphate nucleotidyltransferase [Candidatus Bathyarchaeia archaeon]|nr:sugar phosphate nucleotidyltransferase [Candidatus Bathyarchaeia archaeon]
MVKKAVIAAAGNGTRFLPVTKAYPKELLPVMGEPVIHHLVEEVINAGIKKVAIVHRTGNNLIKKYFSADGNLDRYLKRVGKYHLLEGLRKISRRLVFISQPERLSYGTGAPVLAAKDFIGSDPFVYLYGDDLILEKKTGRFISKLIETFEKYQAAAVFGAQRVPWADVDRYGSVRFKKDSPVSYQIETVEEGLSADEAPSNLVQFGRFVVSSRAVKVLEHQELSSRKELFFTDTMKILAKTGVVIAQPISAGEWLTTGDPERWLATNIKFKKFFA